jgi:trehalose/maltose hydrolase-like predicted phosphorylase
MEFDPLWCVRQASFDVSDNRGYESLFATGNGHFSVRGCPEEGFEDDPQNGSYRRNVSNISLEALRPGKSKWGTYIPGFMSRHPDLGEEMVNLPYFAGIVLRASGERLDLERGAIVEHERWLDLRTGTLCRRLVWRTRSGATLRVEMERYAHMARHALLVQEVRVTAVSGEAVVCVESFIDTDVRTNGHDHLARRDGGSPGDRGRDGGAWVRVETDDGGTVAVVSRLLPDEPAWGVRFDGTRAVLTKDFDVWVGRPLRLFKVSALCTSGDADGGDPLERAVEAVAAAVRERDALRREHEAAWAARWRDADVVIEGDARSQLAVRFAAYHLMRGIAEGDRRIGASSRLATGDIYSGHVFWDNEAFLLPFYLYTRPEAARAISAYRRTTLDGARHKARRYGYRGAMVAWQSSLDGEENCVGWQYADHQVHVSADAVFGMWHVYAATGDEAFLPDEAAEVFWEVARFWTERADARPGGGYDVLGVMGPDEYCHFAHNNAYTNFLARFALEKAAWLYDHLRETAPEHRDAVAARIGLGPSEVERFRAVAAGLTIPTDEARRLVLQSEDFERLAPIDLDALWTDRSKPFGMHLSQEHMYRVRCLKQADVLMLMFLFPTAFTREQMRVAFETYEPITCHDSSLSAPVHATVAAWLGLKQKAWDYWQRAAFLDLELKSHSTPEGLHESALGGTWQAAVFGFAGLRPAYLVEQPTCAPNLPEAWRAMRFTIAWRGTRYSVEIEGKRGRIEPAP